MSSLLYAKFNYNGEWVGLVDYIDRMLGTPRKSRFIKEEERAVANAIERPIITIHRNACGRSVGDPADYIRSEIEPLVDIVCRYTWLSEQNIWKLAYEVLLWKTTPEEQRDGTDRAD